MSDLTKCPCCGAVMLPGHLTAGGYRIIWTAEDRYFGGALDEDERLIEPVCLTGKMHNAAYRCEECGAIIITDYKGKN